MYPNRVHEVVEKPINLRDGMLAAFTWVVCFPLSLWVHLEATGEGEK